MTPLRQPQRRMVQTMFETYNKFRDSVFYDASAWSVSNFYNMQSKGLTSIRLGEEITSTSNLDQPTPIIQTDYAYLLDWDDYNAPAALNYLQHQGLKASTAFKPFTAKTNVGERSFNYGTVMIPVSKQKLSSAEIFQIIQDAQKNLKSPFMRPAQGLASKELILGVETSRESISPRLLCSQEMEFTVMKQERSGIC